MLFVDGPSPPGGPLVRLSSAYRRTRRGLRKLLQISPQPLGPEPHQARPLPAQPVHGALEPLVVVPVDAIGGHVQVDPEQLHGGDTFLFPHAVGGPVDCPVAR